MALGMPFQQASIRLQRHLATLETGQCQENAIAGAHLSLTLAAYCGQTQRPSKMRQGEAAESAQNHSETWIRCDRPGVQANG
jgi:hypothetical protein